MTIIFDLDETRLKNSEDGRGNSEEWIVDS